MYVRAKKNAQAPFKVLGILLSIDEASVALVHPKPNEYIHECRVGKRGSSLHHNEGKD
jgi:hypothetical protein